MKSLELLCEMVVETLKEFSTRRQSLTPLTLKNALSSRAELANLFSQGGFVNRMPNAPPVNTSLFTQTKNTYLEILAHIGPISLKEYVQPSSELKERIQDCRSMEALVVLGKDLVHLLKLFVSRAFEEMDHASDILTELGKDLSGIEEQIFSYKNLNRETYLSNEKFTTHLLSDTDQMSHAFESGNALDDVRGLIASKLAVIRQAIQSKRREDEVRLQEADRRIDELQRSLHGYKEEIQRTKERADTLEKEALLDSLTEVHNRRAYELRIREELKRYHRDGQTFSLILLDIDHFKRVNDSFGHHTGDKCLREVARRIKTTLRVTDFLARYGGEEFVAILAGSSAENAFRIAERIRALIEKTRFSYGDEEIPLTVSVGITEVKPTDGDTESPFARVDDLMYRAKKEGRNRVYMM